MALIGLGFEASAADHFAASGTVPISAEDDVAASAHFMDGAISRDFDAHWDRTQWYDRKENNKPPLPAKTDDASFLRRACVDLAGRLPRAEEVRAFLADASPNKRARLTDTLLTEPGAAEVRFRIYAEAFRVTDMVGNVSQASFIAWLRKAAAEDMPFDDMVRAMIAAKPGTPPAALIERDQGDAFRTACSLANALLGKNLYCAMCHDQPFADHTQMQCYQFAACFAPQKVPANYRYVDAKPGDRVKPIPFGTHYPIGDPDEPQATEENRGITADALAGMYSQRTRQIAALRVWRSLFGAPGFGLRGDYATYGIETQPRWNEVVHPHFENSGTSCFQAPNLAIWMEDDFMGNRHWGAVQVLQEIAERCHMRLGELQRILARTEAYGRESLGQGDRAAASYLTVAPQLRRLPSEVIWDALVARLPGGQENWRPSAQSPQVPDDDHPLRLLGRGRREWPDESQTPVSFDLARFMINGPMTTQAVTLRSTTGFDDLVLSILGRLPTVQEKAMAMQHLRESPETALQDITWALLNTSEFLFER